ncbi:hypothetical protein Glove_275g98 [Diversispora epigaea]|uniref:MULE transposase domain-containing protein n=1 Tax=Diversispora epigaea TaxID=1348612 RepID=A0A397IBA0_9GLOM|nr:hypothetical protein Glove_275g98 [Diversispora epigaea]
MSNKENEENELLENILGFEFKNYKGVLPLINTPMELIQGTQFISMPIAVHFIEQYTCQKKFSIIKYKNETFQDGICRKRVFKCDMGGRYNEKLSRPTLGKQKNKGTKKNGCIWQINVTRGKNSPISTITSFINEHNHELFNEMIVFAIAYKGFSQEIMEQIEFYVTHGHCDITMIRNLLKSKYPDRVFLPGDLGNAIQKIKREKGLNIGDAAFLLTKLLEYQKKNPEWFIKPLINDTSNRLIGIFWISRLAAQAIIQDKRQELYEWLLQCCFEVYFEACEIPPITFVTDADLAMVAAISIIFPKTYHIQCLFHLYLNLPKKLHSSLGLLYQEFFNDFRKIQQSHCKSILEQRLQGTQSTQCAESENALIQKAVQSSFSLLQVQEVLEERLEFETINNCYSIWKTSTLQYSQPFVIQTFFNNINRLLKKYLT